MKLVKILAVAAMLTAGAAQAQLKGYGGFEYTQEENRVTKDDSIKGAFVIGGKTTDGWDVSAKFESGQAELGNGSISSGIETRVRKNWANALGMFTPWAGARIGESIKSDTHFSYYALEGGVKFPIVGALSGDLVYRYRNAFTAEDFETNRASFQLNYGVTKQDNVGLRFARSNGDKEVDAVRLSYTRSF